MSAIDELDAFAILQALVEHELEFFVVGGLAVAHHGYIRATKDVDVVPDPALENLERLHAALMSLDASPIEIVDFRPEEMPVDLTPDGLAFGGNWALATRHGRLDVMQYVAGALESADDYTRMRRASVSAEFDFGTVWFVGYEDLLDLKQLAGRGIDLVDVRALREARGDTAR